MKVSDALLSARSYITILVGFLIGFAWWSGWSVRCRRAWKAVAALR
ncbi:FIG00554977: hypothetical protein [Cronobacter condimenti 1330]|uniref:Uncharacterized protein n=1 Tax=Cronobacter condimenti 1330 TaxID=1073999 RepID=K8AAF9_9ENTR|nr:FIG00554977: hypothetical protein [Cronobacter condimenti 1330]